MVTLRANALFGTARRDAGMAVYCRDRLVPREWTVAQAGTTPMQFVYVDYVEKGGRRWITRSDPCFACVTRSSW
jgi:hypothetical protein